MQQQNHHIEQLNQSEYISHWIPLSSLTSKLSPKKPFKKLRIFKQENFRRKHEPTLNHLHIQRFYLIAYALKNHLDLDLSENYYINSNDELIFGVYRMGVYGNKNGMGIRMNREVDAETMDSFYEIMEKYLHGFCGIVQGLGFSPAGQYEGFIEGINRLFDKKANEVKPETFIQQFQKWPLAQHYVFNVKLRNSMLLPTILEDSDLVSEYKRYIQSEKMFITSVMENSPNYTDLLTVLEEQTRAIFGKLEKKGRIAQMTVNHSKGKAKTKQKQTKQLKIITSFRVILSPSRSQVTINEKQIQENFSPKGSKPLTKIQIKPQNGQLAPVSGNVITVNSIWQIDPQRKNFGLKVQSYNNRILTQLYFDQALQLWSAVQSDPSYQSLTPTSNFSLTLSPNKMMEAAFSTVIPGCMLSGAIREIERVVGVTVAMDQVVEVCERKGMENGDHQDHELGGFMVGQVKDKIGRAFGVIQSNSKALFRG